MKKHAIINYEQFQTVKWEWKQDDSVFHVTFLAPTMVGPWPEKYTKEINIADLQPDEDFWEALARLKFLVCRGMDWEAKAGKLAQIVVVGIEFKRRTTDIYDLFISFEYTSQNTGITAIYKKGVQFTSVEKMKHSLDERELDDVATLAEELRLYVSRRKGMQGDLFSNDWESEDSNSETAEVKMFKN